MATEGKKSHRSHQIGSEDLIRIRGEGIRDGDCRKIAAFWPRNTDTPVYPEDYALFDGNVVHADASADVMV